MPDYTEEWFNNVLEERSQDIERLGKAIRTGFAATQVSFMYYRLKSMGPWSADDITMELLFEIEAMTTALVISYGRLFASSDGTTRISRSKIPMELRSHHDDIMELRNKRYAHHDSHHSVASMGDITFQDGRFHFAGSMRVGMHFGAPREWEPLVTWLGEYLVEQQNRQLRRLSELTGHEWTSPMGPPPAWLSESDDSCQPEQQQQELGGQSSEPIR
ncbi:hypothetical protein R3X27_02160 [Tropicimonas sp. TH_r6]|uniref:hypothetical protein n=1 Tax=Tropicimonas sp. TH_r6 TaxID=3082085 RepID=UPI00295590EE|nr:hypothetical protein [Tropicimonas sp. TH_r6]MDV7141478.1 hypothetical protein [Tropicimonas sp. TH_r6]